MTLTLRQYLVLIDPSTRHPEREVCAEISRRSPLPVYLVRPALTLNQESPTSVTSLWKIDQELIAGVIILGGGASPNEIFKWQNDLKYWLTASGGIMEHSKPILGICYGHQLLAQLCGARVSFLWNGETSKGLRELRLCESTLGLNKGEGHQIVVSHREGVVDTPSRWRTLTQDDQITHSLAHLGRAQAVEAMRHQTKPWWGFQGHIDATSEFLTNNAIRATLPQPYAGSTLIDNFLHLVSSQAMNDYNISASKLS